LGVQGSRKAAHDWVQKADLQPTSGKAPNQVSVDETVIRINDQQYWLSAAADPTTNELLHLRLFTVTTTALPEIFLKELGKNTMPKTLCFSLTARLTSTLHFTEWGSDFRPNAREIGIASNVSSEKEND
jgi:transposase-like protein